MNKKEIAHLRRLVKGWFDRRYISKDQYKVLLEDIETYIKLESKP